MEKVQFQLEATLPELKDLYDKGLFSKQEINQITRRRTNFETSLIRQVTRKADFFKYAEYEINLEKLRKVRWKRLGYDKNPPAPSASTFSLPRRAMYILKRATVKFPGDLAAWLAYVEYASREGMRKVVAKGLTSALQHHPLSPTLYLLTSFHHLHPSSPFPPSAIPSTSTLDLPSASEERESGFSLEGLQPARTTLLLGLRMIPRSHDLWREYIKLELGWVEALRRRWKVLGIPDQPGGKGGNDRSLELVGGEGAFGPDGEDARKAILAGQLVVHALTSALEAIPASEMAKNGQGHGMAFREGLLVMLRTYPSPLRTRCLEVVYEELLKVAAGEGEAAARARLLLITRTLYDQTYNPSVSRSGGIILQGSGLVDELGNIGKAIRRAAKSGDPSFLDAAGRWLERQLEETGDNEALRDYLFSIFTSLIKPSLLPSPDLLLRHLNLLEQRIGASAEVLKMVRQHAIIHAFHPNLQLIRVSHEIRHESDLAIVRKACQDVVKVVTCSGLSDVDAEAVKSIWLAWAGWEETQHDGDPKGKEATWRKILRDSLRIGGGVPELHSSLLSRYYISRLQAGDTLEVALRSITSTYRPGPAFFASALAVLQGRTNDMAALRSIYDAWRAACKTAPERVEAVLAFAEWCIAHGHAKNGSDAVDVVRKEVRADREAASQLEIGWQNLLDEVERDEAVIDADETVSTEWTTRQMVADGVGSDEDAGSSGAEDEDEEDEIMLNDG